MGLTENKRIQHVVATTAAISADDFDGRLAYDTTEQAIRVRAGGVAKYASMRGHTHVKADVVDTTSDINLLDYIPSNLHTAIRSYSSTSDVSSYVQAAVDEAWTRGVGVYVPGGRYFIKQTISLKCARFYGPGIPQSATGSSGDPGAQFRFVPDAGWTDLKAAFECSHRFGVVEGVEVFGGASYSIADMATWCNPALLPSYSAFSAGLAGFRTVGAAQTVFRRIKASGKVGLLIDSEDGHISVYDSTLSGMFGVYQRISSGDMFFQGCGINGTFAGIIFGDLLYAGHYGGMQGCLFRCHMGFSPWGIYQVRDNGTDTSGLTSVSGWAGSLIEVSWEQVGECAMELLPNSASDINIVGGTQGWASIASFRVPTAIRSERMKYWLRLGQVEFFKSTWALQSSGREFFIPSPYADNVATAKAAYIHKLGPRSVRCNWDTLGGSVDIGSGGVDREAGDPRYWRGWRVTKEETEQVQASISPVGNLINNPEVAANWTPNGDAGSGPSITTGAWSSFAELASYAPPVQMVEELGPDPIVTKFVAGTGAGVDCAATINLISGAPVSGRRKFFSYWGICPGATQRNIRTSLVDAGAAKIMDVGRATGRTDWVKHEAYDGSPTHISTQFSLGFHNSASQPTFVAGIMVSVGRTRPYVAGPQGSLAQRRTSAATMGSGIVIWRRQRGDASWSTVNGDPRSMFEVPQGDTLFPANILRVGDTLVWESEFVRLAQSDILGVSVGAAGFGTINSLGTISVSSSSICRLRIEARIASIGVSGMIQTAGWVEIGASMHRVQTSNVESGQTINTTIDNFIDLVVDPSGAQNYGGYVGMLTYFPAV